MMLSYRSTHSKNGGVRAKGASRGQVIQQLYIPFSPGTARRVKPVPEKVASPTGHGNATPQIDERDFTIEDSLVAGGDEDPLLFSFDSIDTVDREAFAHEEDILIAKQLQFYSDWVSNMDTNHVGLRLLDRESVAVGFPGNDLSLRSRFRGCPRAAVDFHRIYESWNPYFPCPRASASTNSESNTTYRSDLEGNITDLEPPSMDDEDQVVVFGEDESNDECDSRGSDETCGTPAIPDEAAALPETVALRNGNAVFPGEASAIPDEALALPEAAALPGEAVALPGEAAAVPDEVAVFPDEAQALPDEAAALPDEAVALLDEALALPEAAAIPGEAAALPGEAAALPGETAALPDEAAALFDKAATDSVGVASICDKDTAIPAGAIIPDGGADAVCDEASALPGEAATLCDEASALPDEAAALPDEAAALLDEAAALFDKAATDSVGAASICDKDTAIPAGAIIPDEGADEVCDEASALPGEASALPDEAATLRDEASALPDEPSALPDDVVAGEAVAISNVAVAISNGVAVISEGAVANPDESAAAPDEAAVIPDEAVALPDKAAGISDEAAAIPDAALLHAVPDSAGIKLNSGLKHVPTLQNNNVLEAVLEEEVSEQPEKVKEVNSERQHSLTRSDSVNAIARGKSTLSPTSGANQLISGVEAFERFSNAVTHIPGRRPRAGSLEKLYASAVRHFKVLDHTVGEEGVCFRGAARPEDVRIIEHWATMEYLDQSLTRTPEFQAFQLRRTSRLEELLYGKKSGALAPTRFRLDGACACSDHERKPVLLKTSTEGNPVPIRRMASDPAIQILRAKEFWMAGMALEWRRYCDLESGPVGKVGALELLRKKLDGGEWPAWLTVKNRADGPADNYDEDEYRFRADHKDRYNKSASQTLRTVTLTKTGRLEKLTNRSPAPEQAHNAVPAGAAGRICKSQLVEFPNPPDNQNSASGKLDFGISKSFRSRLERSPTRPTATTMRSSAATTKLAIPQQRKPIPQLSEDGDHCASGIANGSNPADSVTPTHDVEDGYDDSRSRRSPGRKAIPLLPPKDKGLSVDSTVVLDTTPVTPLPAAKQQSGVYVSKGTKPVAKLSSPPFRRAAPPPIGGNENKTPEFLRVQLKRTGRLQSQDKGAALKAINRLSPEATLDVPGTPVGPVTPVTATSAACPDVQAAHSTTGIIAPSIARSIFEAKAKAQAERNAAAKAPNKFRKGPSEGWFLQQPQNVAHPSHIYNNAKADSTFPSDPQNCFAGGPRPRARPGGNGPGCTIEESASRRHFPQPIKLATKSNSLGCAVPADFLSETPTLPAEVWEARLLQQRLLVHASLIRRQREEVEAIALLQEDLQTHIIWSSQLERHADYWDSYDSETGSPEEYFTVRHVLNQTSNQNISEQRGYRNSGNELPPTEHPLKFKRAISRHTHSTRSSKVPSIRPKEQHNGSLRVPMNFERNSITALSNKLAVLQSIQKHDYRIVGAQGVEGVENVKGVDKEGREGREGIARNNGATLNRWKPSRSFKKFLKNLIRFLKSLFSASDKRTTFGIASDYLDTSDDAIEPSSWQKTADVSPVSLAPKARMWAETSKEKRYAVHLRKPPFLGHYRFESADAPLTEHSHPSRINAALTLEQGTAFYDLRRVESGKFIANSTWLCFHLIPRLQRLFPFSPRIVYYESAVTTKKAGAPKTSLPEDQLKLLLHLYLRTYSRGLKPHAWFAKQPTRGPAAQHGSEQYLLSKILRSGGFLEVNASSVEKIGLLSQTRLTTSKNDNRNISNGHFLWQKFASKDFVDSSFDGTDPELNMFPIPLQGESITEDIGTLWLRINRLDPQAFFSKGQGAEMLDHLQRFIFSDQQIVASVIKAIFTNLNIPPPQPPAVLRIEHNGPYTHVISATEAMFWGATTLDLGVFTNDFHHLGRHYWNKRPATWDNRPVVSLLARKSATRAHLLLDLLMARNAEMQLPDYRRERILLMDLARQHNSTRLRDLIEFSAALLNNSTFVRRVDQGSRSALFDAIESGSLRALRALLEGGAEVNWRDAAGDTPLHWAVRGNVPAAVSLLLAFDADVTIENLQFDDPITEAINAEDHNMATLLIEHMPLQRKTQRGKSSSRLRRLQKAFEMRLPEPTILKLIDAELHSGDAALCCRRDKEDRNLIGVAVELRYGAAVDKLLDYYLSAVASRLPLWQRCNPHEPSSHNREFPIERFLQSDGAFRLKTSLLRRLYSTLVPADGSSFFMAALNEKGGDAVLEQLVPLADPEITLKDLHLHVQERRGDAWSDSALSLANSRGRQLESIRLAMISLLSTGLVEGVPEAYQALANAISTAARELHSLDSAEREEPQIIKAIAVAAPRAVQQWFCRLGKDAPFTVADSRLARFVARNLPDTFVGFSPVGCKPIVVLTLRYLEQATQDFVDTSALEYLLRHPAAKFSPSTHLQEALILLAQTSATVTATSPLQTYRSRKLFQDSEGGDSASVEAVIRDDCYWNSIFWADNRTEIVAPKILVHRGFSPSEIRATQKWMELR